MPLWSPTNKWIEMGVQASSTPTTTKRKDTQRERNCKEILSTLVFLGLASRPASYSGGLHFPLCVCLVASQVTKQESDHSSVPESFLLFNFHLHPSSSSSSSYPLFSHFTTTSSMDYKQLSSLTSHQQPKINRAAARKLVRSGSVTVRERSTFSGTSWKPRKMELDGEALIIISVSIDVHALQK